MWRAVRTCGWAAVVAAPFAVHLTLATGRHAAVAALLSAVQVAMLCLVLLPRGSSLGRIAAILAGGAMALACRFALRHGLAIEAGLAHAGLYGTLLGAFAASLRPGRTPVVTALALRLGGPRPSRILAYTRRVTVAWCVFFAAQLGLSALLLLAAPLADWSLFINVLDLPSVGLMFAAEYAYRLWRFRNEKHVPLATIIRAFASRPPSFRGRPADAP